MSNFWCCGRQVCPSINIWTVSSLANALFNIGTLDSFLAGSESNWVFGVCCSVQMVFQQVQTSSTKHTTGIKNPSIYNIIRWFPGLLEQMTKCLMFQVLFFFHWILQKPFQFVFLYKITKMKIKSVTKLWKKILRMSEARLRSRLSHRPSKPAHRDAFCQFPFWWI